VELARVLLRTGHQIGHIHFPQSNALSHTATACVLVLTNSLYPIHTIPFPQVIEELFIVVCSAMQELGDEASEATKKSMTAIADFTYKTIAASFLKNNRSELVSSTRVLINRNGNLVLTRTRACFTVPWFPLHATAILCHIRHANSCKAVADAARKQKHQSGDRGKFLGPAA
jgi:hypothetical protein